MNNKLLALVGIVLLASTAVVYVYSQYVVTIPNDVIIVGEGLPVYWFDNKTMPVSRMNWTVVGVGSSTNLTIYVHNNMSIPVLLNITVDDWNPADAYTYLSVSSNYDNSSLILQEVRPLTFTLNVSLSAPPSTASFNVNITPEET